MSYNVFYRALQGFLQKYKVFYEGLILWCDQSDHSICYN